MIDSAGEADEHGDRGEPPPPVDEDPERQPEDADDDEEPAWHGSSVAEPPVGGHAVAMATTRALPVLRGERVVLRPVREDDAGALLAVLSEPEVAAGGRGWDEARVRRDLIAEQEWEVVVAIEVGGEVAGMLLVGEEEEPEYRHASLDIALATAYQGEGSAPRRCGS